MKVFFDAQIFRQQQYGGISRYCCELATRLAAEPGVDARIVAPHHRNAYLAALPPGLLTGWPASRFRRLGKLSRWLARRAERQLVLRDPPDLVHATYYGPSPLAHAGARRVLTVYDMIHERFAHHFAADEPTAAAKRRAVAQADHLLCISHSTRRDLIAILGVPESKVSVTHLASSLEPPAAETGPSHGEPPFVLYVSDRGGYKNFMTLVRALASSPALAGVQLRCFGGGPMLAQEWAAIEAAGLPRARVRHQMGDDALLARLYAQAQCLVYPSLYEGFGIPPLEAMRCDCPVVCSNTSSLPEVVGDAAELFNPQLPEAAEALRTAIERVLLSPTRRAELVARGRVQAQRFSWDRCASQTLAAYRQLLA